MIDTYRTQAVGLLYGGVDALLLETSQDTRNVKAGIIGIHEAFRKTGLRVPLMISATIEPMGTMLAGQTIDAFYCSVEHSGMAFDRIELRDRARIHGRPVCARCTVSRDVTSPAIQTPGLPDENGKYNETPQMIASALARFIEHGWVNVVGGCCGTNPDYIRAIAEVASAGASRAFRCDPRKTHISGIDYVECEESSRPLIVGERTNEVGSRKFKRLIESEKFEEAAEVGRAQVRAGAQLIDVNLAERRSG